MHSPRNCIQQPDQARLTNPPPKQRIGSQRPKRIVPDLGICRTRPTMNQVQVIIRSKYGSIQHNQPHIDPHGGHAVVGTLDALVYDLPPCTLQRAHVVIVGGTVADDLIEGEVSVREDGFADTGAFDAVEKVDLMN